MNTKIIFNAGVYVRLSKDDGDKVESNSIKNQKSLIEDYIKEMPEIAIKDYYVDDGFSGVNFSRPSFKNMIEDIKSNKINCIIVKDFSRFGRNYIEVGKYLENFFPFLNVRFISVNDRYDSFAKQSASDELIVPFKNLINDLYSKDISIKIRSQLAVKSKNGEFIGAFATYGYMKLPEYKNKLVVDEYASRIVRDIFKWKLDGMSQQGIADKLNELGELSPLAYKRNKGINHNTPFKRGNQSKWCAVKVGRILKNPIYTGVLEQGKVSTPNHKVKAKINKPREEWYIVENSHDAIISKEIFDIVNNLLKSDTRISPNKTKVYNFAGILYCGDCKNTMSRKIITRGGKKYIYYVCSTKKNAQGCTFHNFSEIELEQIVLNAINLHIKSIRNVESIILYINSLSLKEQEINKINSNISVQTEEISKYKNLKVSVYEDYKDLILEEDEYMTFSNIYSEKLSIAKNNLEKLRGQLNILLDKDYKGNDMIEYFNKFKNINTLDRKIIISLIEKIEIYENNRIEIKFLYADQYEELIKSIDILNEFTELKKICI